MIYEPWIGILILVVVGAGLIFRKRVSQKTSYIAHLIVLSQIFFGNFADSLTMDYQIQAVPWWDLAILYSIPVVLSLIVGIILDLRQFWLKHRK